MKTQIRYIAALLGAAVLLNGCSKEADSIASEGSKGVLAMNISGTRAEGSTTYNPMDRLLVRIYNDKGLIRRYKAETEIPASLELLTGAYTVKVEAGEKADASFEKRFYAGEKAFDITAGGTTSVEVKCKLQSVAAEVKFDPTVATTFGSQFNAQIMAANTFNATAAADGSMPSLTYTVDATGYFTLPEGVTSLAWHFEGTPQAGGAKIVKEGVMTNIAAGNRYRMTFQYSKDLPGYISLFVVRVDTSTEDKDDTIVFSPDPMIEGSGFDISQTQDYIAGTTGDKVYKISTMAAIKGISLAIDNGSRVDLLTAAPAGITVNKTDNYSATVTLSAAAFAGLSGGNHSLSFRVTDAGGADVIKNSAYRMQGILPVTAEDYNLWTNTVTLKAMVLATPTAGVNFGLRVANGDWQDVAATDAGNNLYTASFSAAWVESTNEGGLKIYTPTPTTGVFAGRSYEVRMVLGATTSSITFTTEGKQSIPNGNMENTSASCFGTSNSGTTEWGSGNNSFTKGLCTSGTFSGMGGSACAKMSAGVAAGIMAAGNLFLGTFNFSTFSGTVGFGQKYVYTARPTALRCKVHATVGTVTHGTASNYEYIKDGQDCSRIFVVITNWDNRHGTTSGTGSPSGTWDPLTASSLSEGPIIGYGSLPIKTTTSGNSMVTVDIPIHYYDKTTQPSKAYTLSISCATSMYGDFKVGCSTNVMYVDDFEWVY